MMSPSSSMMEFPFIYMWIYLLVNKNKLHCVQQISHNRDKEPRRAKLVSG